MSRAVLRAQRAFRLWRPGETVLVGVSGGADSSALLCALAELPRAERPHLLAAHFDHGLRGPAAAERDAMAIGRLCHRLGVEVFTGTADPEATGRESPEAAARRARYTFLARTAARQGAGVVAVGHHRDDRVETVLLRLLRGSGAGGAAGIRPSRTLNGPDGYRGVLVRPLWFADREQVIAYATAADLTFVDDPSNRDVSKPRNLLRHVILPALDAGLGAGYRTALLRTAENLAADDEALRAWAEHFSSRLERDGWLDSSLLDAHLLPASVHHRVLQGWWSRSTGLPRLSRRHVQSLSRLAPGGGLDLPRGFRAHHGRAGLSLRPPVPPDHPGVALPVPGEVLVPGVGRLSARLVESPGLVARGQGKPEVAIGAAEGLAYPLMVRAPRPGERLMAIGAPSGRPVRELLRAAGVPPQGRRRPWVVTDAAGRLLWIAGVRQASAFALPSDWHRALLLELVRPGAAGSDG